jgi:hypothetical protein
MDLPPGYELIQEPFYVLLPPIIEEPLPLPDADSVTDNGCTYIRVRKGNDYVDICIPKVPD